MKRWFCRGLALLLPMMILLSGCSDDEAVFPRPTEGYGVATVNAVGDIYLTGEMLADAQSGGTYNFVPQLKNVFSALAAADLTVGNFEGIFAGAPYGGETGSYPDELATVLSNAGFDLLQTANSYSINGGLTGLSRTKSIIEQNGMETIGTYRDATERNKAPVVLREVNGVRIAFVAFTKGFGGLALPEGAADCVNLLYSDYTTNYSEMNTSAIRSVLQAAQKQEPDIIIAMLHWGSENDSTVSKSQEEIADFLFQNDVDVILGSHSHVIGEVERRTIRMENGEEKEVVLAYGLGDFCAAEKNSTKSSLILHLEFTRDHAAGITTISDVSYIPVAAVDNGIKASDRYAVLDIDNAIELYESNYYNRVSYELYQTLLERRESILSRVEPDEE